jgi:ApaG protein
MGSPYLITVSVQARFLPDQSIPERDRYAFAYLVRIENQGSIAAQLQSRHWIIEDADGHREDVRGPGVVGEFPNLQPGESYEYQSGAVLSTPFGQMHGTYQMKAEDGHEFDAQIPSFTLNAPRVLH